MPSRGHPITDETGRVIGIACTRGNRYVKCGSCKADGAKLSCDGCDAALCAACSVSPDKKLDFCPTCFKPAFDWWKENAGGKDIYAKQGKALGRIAFRAWAKGDRDRFFALAKPRTVSSKQEVP